MEVHAAKQLIAGIFQPFRRLGVCECFVLSPLVQQFVPYILDKKLGCREGLVPFG